MDPNGPQGTEGQVAFGQHKKEHENQVATAKGLLVSGSTTAEVSDKDDRVAVAISQVNDQK